MQFLLNVLDDQLRHGSDEEMAAVTAFNMRLRDEGKFIYANGLANPADSIVFDNRNNKGEMTKGPYVEGKEFIIGFWLLEIDNPETASEIASEASLHCNRKIELRPVL
jgi:hypothetical protein